MKRIMILAVAAVMLAVAAVPAIAQTDDKAAKRAAKKAAKQEQRVQNTAPAKGGVQKAVPAQEAVPDNAFAQKALPSSGGTSAGNVALLGTGVLLVGGGLLVRRLVR